MHRSSAVFVFSWVTYVDVVSAHRLVTGGAEHQIVHHLKPKTCGNMRQPSTKKRFVKKETHPQTEHSFGMTVQRAQEQAALGVSHADGAVVGADEQQAACALL